MTPWQQILSYLAITAAIFGIGWTVRGWKDDAALNAANSALVKAQQAHFMAMQAISSTYEQERQDSQTTIAQLQQQVRESHVKNPASICHIDSDSLHTIHSAIHSATGRPGSKLPTNH